MNFQDAVSIITSAILKKNKVIIRFNSKDDSSTIQRTCAPLDIGPSRRSKEQNDRFHFWDYDSDKRQHVLSINPEQLVDIEISEEIFDPHSIVNWDTQKSPWFIKRDWGKIS